jgi:hypothetical protein
MITWNTYGQVPTPARPSEAHLLTIGSPDVLDLASVLKIPASFALLYIEPVDDSPFVRENLLEISNGSCLGGRSAGSVRKAPERIHVIVFGNSLE